jgi:CYTH domain-containing protein
MAQEIERKFLVSELPNKLEQYENKEIEQRYLVDTEEAVVRIRKKGNTYFLTIKSAGTRSRQEIETELSVEQYQKLNTMEGPSALIRKTRFNVPDGDYTIELDLFHDNLSGLIVAEVEFPDLESSEKYQPPAWLGKEVTDDTRYQNSKLAKLGKPKD